MSVSVRFVEGPIADEATRDCSSIECGARLVFDGIVREMEDGRRIHAIDYEAYRPMADRELERLARETARRFPIHAIEVIHSVGKVEVGRCSFRLVLRSAHRQEALAAAAHFIDSMKRDVPIWKHPRGSE
ncbi:MAG: molybdenum cofactor biosynthesis protein MoaE [Phycisphaerae bacterium]|nr:molybdenum cofactor biosynthesis protein MoaE [Phycisphaerae bacterium]